MSQPSNTAYLKLSDGEWGLCPTTRATIELVTREAVTFCLDLWFRRAARSNADGTVQHRGLITARRSRAGVMRRAAPFPCVVGTQQRGPPKKSEFSSELRSELLPHLIRCRPDDFETTFACVSVLPLFELGRDAVVCCCTLPYPTLPHRSRPTSRVGPGRGRAVPYSQRRPPTRNHHVESACQRQFVRPSLAEAMRNQQKKQIRLKNETKPPFY